MTGERDYARYGTIDLREFNYDAARLSIGHVLRRAAGLPDEEDPFIKRSDEAHLPNVEWVFRLILGEFDSGGMIKKFGVEKAEVEKIHRDLKKLVKRIASLDLSTQSGINLVGFMKDERLMDKEISDEDDDLMMALGKAALEVPPQARLIPAALLAMERLDTVIVHMIKRRIEIAAELNEKTKPLNRQKNEIALVVALYLEDVTGDIPGLTTRPVVTGPFALALQEIFEILGLPKGVQHPGDYAISELTSYLSKNSEL